METKKIALACSIGAMLFCAVALVVAPHYTWLALFAGIAGGYLSYEFREVCKAVPAALGSAAGELAGDGSEILREFGTYLRKPHPFAFLATICEAAFLAWGSVPYYHEVGLRGEFFQGLILAAMVMAIPATFLGFVLAAFALFGAMDDKCSWFKDDESGQSSIDIAHGLRYVTLSYSTAFRWMFIGIVKFILVAVILCWRFARYFFRLIHSNKRLLCATDGTLGGIMSYYYFSASAHAFPAKCFLVLCGGLFGATLGVFNWEIVSKRILHIKTA